MPESFLVIVKCMTFNHHAYIEDAMKGFCMQKTDFPYICIVMDDCSTDGEQEEIKRYYQENFDQCDTEETDDYVLNFGRHKINENCYFAVFYLKYNHYSIKKDKTQYYAKWQDSCKYIAFCEGDDYWIDENKLQTQADFLERNVEYGMCYTRAKVYNQEKESLTSTLLGKDYISFIDLLKTNCIPTLTVIIRTNLYLNYIKDVKPEQENWLMGDYPMWLWFSKNSQIKYYQYITSVYRLLQNSASHSTDVDKIIKFNESVYDIKRFYVNKYNVDYNLGEDYNLAVFQIYFGILMQKYNREYAKKLRIYGSLQSTKKTYKFYCLLSYNILLWFLLKIILSIKKQIVRKSN